MIEEKKKLISIITPVLNEEENVTHYYNRISSVIQSLSDRYQFEIIITDNCSSDRTFELFTELAQKDRRFRIFRFSRNFGFQNSIWTGYSKARGEAAIEIDCDLQDPPELLGEFLREWERGTKIVYGIRKTRKEGKIITTIRKLFYRFINRISDQHLPHDAGDFMLIDRAVLNEITMIKDHHLYLRGTIFGLGFSRKGIVFDREIREFGTSKFSLSKMVLLALDGIISQSILPLRIASYVGIAVAILMFVMSGFYVVGRLFNWFVTYPGFTTTTVLILFSISLNGIFLGIIGEYLARVYVQLKNRPIVIIEKAVDSVQEKNP